MRLRIGDTRNADCGRCKKKRIHAVCAYFSTTRKEFTLWLKCTRCGKMVNLARIPEEKIRTIRDLFDFEAAGR